MEITLENIEYKRKKINYHEREILKKIDLKIKEGQISAIIGSNGTGKSTILDLIKFSLEPTNGKIIINDNPINSKENVKQIKKYIGYVSQSPQDEIMNKTIREELETIIQINNYKRSQIYKRIEDVLTMVNLDKEKLEENPKNLSHSEIRKLALAKSLICNPKILILDEPVANLDKKNKEEIIKLLKLLKNRYRKTIIIVSHDLNFIHKIADYIFLLHNKKIALEGTKYEIFKKEETLKKYNLLPPKIMLFSDRVLKLKKIKIGYRDEINDLIKDIYRYVK